MDCVRNQDMSGNDQAKNDNACEDPRKSSDCYSVDEDGTHDLYWIESDLGSSTFHSTTI